jgi:hypothetical protein
VTSSTSPAVGGPAAMVIVDNVTCPIGEVALSGGWELSFTDNNDFNKVFVQSSMPASSGLPGSLTGDQWQVTLSIVSNLGGGNFATLKAIALCSD